MRSERQQLIRALFDEYIEMYASRDDRLTTRFSHNFSGYAGSSNILVKDRDEWIKVTRQDFAQVPGRIRIEMLDLSMQDLSDDVVITTAFFHIHLPIPDIFLSRDTARLVLVFRLEDNEWKIVHSGISVPYRQATPGEVYPLQSLHERNRELEELVEQRTQALKNANQQLERLSNTDGLTNIANRRFFDHQLQQEWNRARRAGLPLSLLMLDVDHFKHYNDLYGHLAGDACLQTLATTLTATMRRGGELVARYGGEEFVALLPGVNEGEAEETARRIQQAVWSLALPHTQTSPGIITVSIGVASIVPSLDHTPEDLLRQADWGLYRAKKSGRNTLQSSSE
ncbi:MAG: diguanylate cyclase protein [Burkholderiaceae bacterium]|nr:diguanylate cyclase protein [Burkholderiaceae bacterium]